jgi:hypothetical protein
MTRVQTGDIVSSYLQERLGNWDCEEKKSEAVAEVDAGGAATR